MPSGETEREVRISLFEASTVLVRQGPINSKRVITPPDFESIRPNVPDSSVV